MRKTEQALLIWVGLGLVAVCHAPEAAAQAAAARTFAELGNLVAVGQNVTVTDASGAEVKGKITQLSPTSLTIAAREATRTFTESEVRLVQQRRRDSILNGLLIGAAVGAVPGILTVFCDDCSSQNSAAAAVAAVGLGAAIGALVDYGIKGKNVTLFLPAEAKKTSLSIAPLVDSDRKGVSVALRF